MSAAGSLDPVATSRVGGTGAPTRLRLGLIWAALLVVPAVVCGAAAFAASLLMPALYAAQAEIVFSVGDAAAPVPEQTRATQAVIATGRAVLYPAATELGLPADKLALSLTAEFPKGGAIMRLQFSDREATQALHVLDAVVRSYLGVLETLKAADSPAFRLLNAPYLLDKAVWPQPLLAAAAGSAIGLLLAMGAMAIFLYLRASG